MTEQTITDVYTQEGVLAEMSERYVAAVTDTDRADVVEALAEELGKSVQSVRGKLHFMGVYVAKIVAVKGNTVTKDALATEIADIASEQYGVNISDGEAESLAKANKSVLNKLIKMLDVSD